MAKQKQFVRPPKKSKVKSTTLETADDFQEAADLEEEAGGKWRAGDPAKSGRAFVRALDLYDRGLRNHPGSFDLAYNKARLQLEITQRPLLIAHIGVPLEDLLQQTLTSHRYALRLNEQNVDILFNTSQVLTSLAESLAERGDQSSAVGLLHEALELLSACLSRQEMALEQQQVDLEDLDEGGVSLEPDEQLGANSSGDDVEETATVERLVTFTDLLDTVHASLSALTTLVAFVEPGNLQTLADMAHSLTETKAPAYLGLLAETEQLPARFALALARAIFLAALADAQYNAMAIDLETYFVRLSAFDVAGRDTDAAAFTSEAEARAELVKSVLVRFETTGGLPMAVCWKELSTSQELLAKAAKIEGTAQVYLLRGDIELIRHRMATMAKSSLSASTQRSAAVLAANAHTYYKGAAKLSGGELDDKGLEGRGKFWLVAALRSLLYGVAAVEVEPVPVDSREAILRECVEESLIDASLAESVLQHVRGR